MNRYATAPFISSSFVTGRARGSIHFAQTTGHRDEHERGGGARETPFFGKLDGDDVLLPDFSNRPSRYRDAAGSGVVSGVEMWMHADKVMYFPLELTRTRFGVLRLELQARRLPPFPSWTIRIRAAGGCSTLATAIARYGA
jgi:hypothetical protein